MTWQVGLIRPSSKQLQLGVIDSSTARISEERCDFFTTGDTLMQALLSLQDKIYNAGPGYFKSNLYA